MTEVSEAVWEAFTGDPMDPKNDTAAGLSRVAALFEADIERLKAALKIAADQLALVHSDAFEQCGGQPLVKYSGGYFSHMQINNCETAARKARATLNGDAS